jgi:chaperonin GroES
MAIRPLHDRILVRRKEEETKSAGGIILTDGSKEKPMQGEVIAAGNGKILPDGSVLKLGIKVGDKILFGKYSGTEIKLENEELLMMREEDVMAIVE